MDPVTICNMALNAFGASPIVSIDEGQITSDEAQLCATFYDPSVRAVLEEGAPLFATGFFDLGARQDSDYKNVGGEHTLIAKFPFDLTKFVRPLACDDGSGDFTIRWERNGEFLICEDTAKLYCRAVQLLLDPNKWTPGYVWATAYRLAYAICGPLTHSQAVKKEMLEEYKSYMKTGKNLDGMAGTSNQQVKIKSTSLAGRR